jgi:PAS domain S-box-containing protein
MDEKGIIVEVNQAFINCFGYEHKEIIGNNTAFLFTEKIKIKVCHDRIFFHIS